MKQGHRLFLKVLVVVVLCGSLGLAADSALALDIWLTPASQTPSPGDTSVSVQVWFDFSDDPTIGGGLDIAFDATRLAFVSWTPENVGDSGFARVPDVLPGLLSGIAMGDFSVGISGPGLWGTLVFDLLNPGTALITPGDSASVAGPFFSLQTFTQQTVEYTGAEIIIDQAVATAADSWGSLKASYR